MVGVMRWFVTTQLRWRGKPRVKYHDPANISHYFETGNRTACGNIFFGVFFGEKKAASIAGERPRRCKNCERVLAARTKSYTRR